jgi:hypothetical protein
MAFKPRHRDCPSCKHFNPTRATAPCVPCGFGENFEEKPLDDEPSDEELMNFYAGMERDDDNN